MIGEMIVRNFRRITSENLTCISQFYVKCYRWLKCGTLSIAPTFDEKTLLLSLEVNSSSPIALEGLSCVKHQRVQPLFFSLGIKEHAECCVIKHVRPDNAFAKVPLF